MTFSFVLNALSVVLLAVVLYRLYEIELKLQTEEQEYPQNIYPQPYAQTFKPIAQPSPVSKKLIEQDDDKSSESGGEEEEEEGEEEIAEKTSHQ